MEAGDWIAGEKRKVVLMKFELVYLRCLCCVDTGCGFVDLFRFD